MGAVFDHKQWSSSGSTPTPLTDLLGTTWTWDTEKFETVPYDSGNERTDTYDVEFTADGGDVTRDGIIIDNLAFLPSLYYRDNDDFDMLFDGAEWYDPPKTASGDDSEFLALADALTITFTGGDATNSDLIAFMQTYATRVS